MSEVDDEMIEVVFKVFVYFICCVIFEWLKEFDFFLL